MKPTPTPSKKRRVPEVLVTMHSPIWQDRTHPKLPAISKRLRVTGLNLGDLASYVGMTPSAARVAMGGSNAGRYPHKDGDFIIGIPDSQEFEMDTAAYVAAYVQTVEGSRSIRVSIAEDLSEFGTVGSASRPL